jgi:hypothetical protein
LHGLLGSRPAWRLHQTPTPPSALPRPAPPSPQPQGAQQGSALFRPGGLPFSMGQTAGRAREGLAKTLGKFTGAAPDERQ